MMLCKEQLVGPALETIIKERTSYQKNRGASLEKKNRKYMVLRTDRCAVFSERTGQPVMLKLAIKGRAYEQSMRGVEGMGNSWIIMGHIFGLSYSASI